MSVVHGIDAILSNLGVNAAIAAVLSGMLVGGDVSCGHREV